MHIKFVYYKKTGKQAYTGECNIEPIPGCRTPKDYGNHLNRHGLLPGICGGRWFGIFSIEINNTIEYIRPSHELQKFSRQQ